MRGASHLPPALMYRTRTRVFHPPPVLVYRTVYHMCFCYVPANNARVPQVAICHGPYPRELIKSWHAWDRKNGSENEPVDAILKPASSSKADAAAAQAAAAAQLYLVLAMGDSGRDLEKHVLSRGLEEATAILVQVWGGGGVERQRCGEVEVWRPAH